MNEQNRRDVLSKLGLGAAAVVAAATAGGVVTPGVAHAARGAIRVRPAGGAGEVTQIVARFNRGEVSVAEIRKVERVNPGWNLGGRQGGSLTLGVRVVDGQVEINGLNDLLVNAHADNRCNASLSLGEDVSNPNPVDRVRTPVVRPGGG